LYISFVTILDIILAITVLYSTQKGFSSAAYHELQ